VRPESRPSLNLTPNLYADFIIKGVEPNYYFINGEWFTKGSDGKEDTMCYFFEDVPGFDGKLGECFALVLMFNPRVGARWPSRFEQGNSYE